METLFSTVTIQCRSAIDLRKPRHRSSTQDGVHATGVIFGLVIAQTHPNFNEYVNSSIVIGNGRIVAMVVSSIPEPLISLSETTVFYPQPKLRIIYHSGASSDRAALRPKGNQHRHIL